MCGRVLLNDALQRGIGRYTKPLHCESINTNGACAMLHPSPAVSVMKSGIISTPLFELMAMMTILLQLGSKSKMPFNFR